MYGHDLSNSRSAGAAGPTTATAARLAELWRFRSQDGDFTGTPVVSHGEVVVGSSRGTVFAISLSSGTLTWSRAFHTVINGSAAIDAGTAYIPLATVGAPALAAIRLSDGALRWQRTIGHQPGTEVYASPVVWNHTVYLGTTASAAEDYDARVHPRGALVALDARTGSIRWTTFTVPRGSDGGAVATTPAIDTKTGRLYIGTGNAYHAPAGATTDAVLELDARSGKLLHHFQATRSDVNQGLGPQGGLGPGPDFDFEASPNLFVSPKGRPLVGEGQKSGIYWALDRRTLRPVWRTTVAAEISNVGGILGSTALGPGHIYGPGSKDGETWSLTTRGVTAWTALGVGLYHLAPVSAANGVLYSMDHTGQLTVRNAASGALLASPSLGFPSWGGVAIAGPIVVAVTGTQTQATGDVVAFSVR
jgi:polyvinyl alcohol dehydrogenase (cytochrome)